MRSKDVERLGEDVVVDEAGVDGEERHQEDDVSAAEEDVEDLVLTGNFLQSGIKQILVKKNLIKAGLFVCVGPQNKSGKVAVHQETA